MDSTLEIVRAGKRETYPFNGDAETRQAAKAAFEQAMGAGMTLASVVDAPGKSTQVRTWGDVEKAEKERGTVTVRQQAPLIGG